MLRRKTAAYALLAMYEIALQQQGETQPIGIRAQDIAQKHGLPRAYAAKILSQLSGAGILHSDRGPRGGFRLSRPVDQVSLFDVFSGVGAIMVDEDPGAGMEELPAVVRAVLDNANREAIRSLRELYVKTKLADLLPQVHAA